MFSNSSLQGIERISLYEGHSYTVKMADGNVAAGQTMTIFGQVLGAGDSLVFDGSAETDGGRFTVKGGEGADTITGRLESDRFTLGGGADIVRYTSVAQSNGLSRDTVNGFDAAEERFDVVNAITGVDAAITSGRLDGPSFDASLAAAVTASHLLAHHAVLFTPTQGLWDGDTCDGSERRRRLPGRRR